MRISDHYSQPLTDNFRLVHDYSHNLEIHEERQLELQAVYGFTCTCAVCSLPEADRQASDNRRKEFHALEEEIMSSMWDIPILCLRNVKRLLDIIEEEGLSSAHEAKVWYYACQVALVSLISLIVNMPSDDAIRRTRTSPELASSANVPTNISALAKASNHRTRC